MLWLNRASAASASTLQGIRDEGSRHLCPLLCTEGCGKNGRLSRHRHHPAWHQAPDKWVPPLISVSLHGMKDVVQRGLSRHRRHYARHQHCERTCLLVSLASPSTKPELSTRSASTIVTSSVRAWDPSKGERLGGGGYQGHVPTRVTSYVYICMGERPQQRGKRWGHDEIDGGTRCPYPRSQGVEPTSP